MKVSFQFGGQSHEAYTNQKIYNGIQYVDVKHGYQTARGQWDHEAQNWRKRIGFSEYDEAVARALGFIKELPMVEAAPKPRKPRARKELPADLVALQLPEGQTVRLVRGQLKIVQKKGK